MSEREADLSAAIIDTDEEEEDAEDKALEAAWNNIVLQIDQIATLEEVPADSLYFDVDKVQPEEDITEEAKDYHLRVISGVATENGKPETVVVIFEYQDILSQVMILKAKWNGEQPEPVKLTKTNFADDAYIFTPAETAKHVNKMLAKYLYAATVKDTANSIPVFAPEGYSKGIN